MRSGGEAKPWGERSRRGHEEFSSTKGWEHQAACHNDVRFIERTLPEPVIADLIAICHGCPVEQRCFLWAKAQTQPVGFAVAGGHRWKAWNHCAICGKKVRGIDRCAEHEDYGDPIGTIEPDGTGREYSVLDEH